MSPLISRQADAMTVLLLELVAGLSLPSGHPVRAALRRARNAGLAAAIYAVQRDATEAEGELILARMRLLQATMESTAWARAGEPQPPAEGPRDGERGAA